VIKAEIRSNPSYSNKTNEGEFGMTIYTTAGRGRCYDDIVQTVGDTPCVRLNRTGPSHVTLYVKVESFNPLSSVKDRLALNIIEAAERDGLLRAGANCG
jgi:cysteine synthase A